MLHIFNELELIKFKCNLMMHPYNFYTFYRYQSVKTGSRYSGTPLIRSPMGQKKLAVLTRGFFTRKCMAVFARLPEKNGRNNAVTVLPISGRKAGFH